jgi:hypothetical protein
MKLKQIFMEALEDFDDAPLPGMDNGRVLSLPHTNFSISFFPDEKRILFTPQAHEELPNKIQDFVSTISEYFHVSKIDHEDGGIFEIHFDPRQDFDKVVLFIKEEMGVDEEL